MAEVKKGGEEMSAVPVVPPEMCYNRTHGSGSIDRSGFSGPAILCTLSPFVLSVGPP